MLCHTVSKGATREGFSALIGAGNDLTADVPVVIAHARGNRIFAFL
jgi:hypothetical protein